MIRESSRNSKEVGGPIRSNSKTIRVPENGLYFQCFLGEIRGLYISIYRNKRTNIRHLLRLVSADAESFESSNRARGGLTWC